MLCKSISSSFPITSGNVPVFLSWLLGELLLQFPNSLIVIQLPYQESATPPSLGRVGVNYWFVPMIVGKSER